MDPHTTQSSETPTAAWFDSKFFKSCTAIMPFFRWAIVLAMFIFGAYIYQRDTNAQQVFNIGDMKRDHETLRSRVNELKDLRDKQFEEMNRKILTREVFEAYHKVDSERLDRMEKVVEQILDRQVK